MKNLDHYFLIVILRDKYRIFEFKIMIVNLVNLIINNSARRTLVRNFYLSIFILCLFPLISSTQDISPVIQISANVYVYRLDGEKQLGLFYQYNRTSGSVQNSDVFLHGTENVNEQAIGALDISGSFATLKYGSIDYNLKTAIEEGHATLINHQRAIVSDGEHFSFSAGEKVPLTKVVMKGNNITLDTEERPVGIKLNGTPRIFRGDNIIMDLEIESSEITQINTFDRGDEKRYTLPVIAKRNIKTVVIVPSDRPVYIGGLYTDTTGDLTRKVPIIGDLPIIGFFLRGFNKSRRQSETIFRITPVIKKPGEGLDIGSSIFEELLQPEGDLSLIQQTGVREKSTEANSSSIITPATSTLMVPSPLIKMATEVVNQKKPETNKSTGANKKSSKRWSNK